MASSYHHILLATDLASDESFLQDRAIELAKNYGAKLTVVHVVQDVPAVFDIYGYVNAADLNDKLEADARKALQKLGDALNIAESNLKIVHGNAKEQIVEVANELSCDLVVIGAHTRTGLAKFLGSTANGVTQGAQCDVFIVKCPNEDHVK